MREKKQYTVKPTGRSGFVYREGDRSISVFTEFLVDDDFDLAAHLSRVVSWNSPAGALPLTDADRERIKKRAEEGLKVNIEWV